MQFLRYVFSAFLLMLLCAHQVNATHIRAGEITARRDATDPYKYYFTLTIYRDTQGVDQPKATLDFGVAGATQEVDVSRGQKGTILGNGIEVLQYFYTYTYPGPNPYTISFTEENRNAGVVNMSASETTPFHIETQIIILPPLGANNSVLFRNPPIDQAAAGQRFCHNPDAYDPDGDSLSFRIVTPRQSRGQDVNGYRSPETVPNKNGTIPQNEAQTGNATFTIDPTTGMLCWDAPGNRDITDAKAAQYNVAFVVEEWRKTPRGYVKVGQVTRDMQILVKDLPNKRPELKIPNDTCIVAGTILEVPITATDPDRNPITISSTSAIFDTKIFPAPVATLVPKVAQPQPSPATSTFRWQSACVHVRDQPYTVVFKAEDSPIPKENVLTDTKAWQITVVGPRPTGLKATPSARSIRLNWNPYTCTNASQMIIWRKVGCATDSVDICETGTPPGYVEVGRVPINTTTFLDNTGLDFGVKYSYRISAAFAAPAGGNSAASYQVCLDLLLEVPLITHVDVNKTGPEGTGEIIVKWVPPLEINKQLYPGPYRYDLYRAEGLNGQNFGATPVGSITSNTIEADQFISFTDRGLNTEDKAYNYKLLFYNQSVLLDTSQTASSVRLTATPRIKAVELSWEANVPWSNNNTTHKVYRENRQTKGKFDPLADVPVTTPGSFKFIDTGGTVGLDDDSTYCYYVETYGTYDNPLIPPVLINRSQILCAAPLDTYKPCPPVLAIDPVNCDSILNPQVLESIKSKPLSDCITSTVSNHLTWTYPGQVGGIACDDDVVKYRVYYKRYEEDKDFTLIDSVTSPTPPSTAYIHKNLTSYAGCYYVTAVDNSGNESLPSNVVCKDNCPYYVLPNVITPNGDGDNDILRPYSCPLFVKSVSFTLNNRWGRKVFETNDIYIRWNGNMGEGGESSSGPAVSTGVYYYLAEVTFERLRRRDEKARIKGWVQVLK